MFSFCRNSVSGLLVSVCLASSLVWAEPPPVAKWRFGRVQVTELSPGHVRLYMSLRNQGDPSQEAVSLYIVPPQSASPAGTPVLVLTDRTQGQRSAIVEATVALPTQITSASKDHFRLLLQVDQTVTDMLPIEEGKPNENAAERRQFQN